MYDYSTYRPKSPSEIAEQARRAEAIGFDSVWVMDHVFIQRRWRRVLSHDPMLSLAQVAAVTSTITIGTLVLSHAFRHVVQLAREASALAASSEGRLVLGLGTGWHQPEFDALGLPFDHRVGRLEEAFEPLERLLRGEPVTLDGTWLRLEDASIAVTSAAPPLWIAAEGPRMIALAARANGWNHAYWGAEDTTRFETGLRVRQDGLEQRHRILERGLATDVGTDLSLCVKLQQLSRALRDQLGHSLAVQAPMQPEHRVVLDQEMIGGDCLHSPRRKTDHHHPTLER